MERFDLELLKKAQESNGEDLDTIAELWSSLRPYFVSFFRRFKKYLRSPCEIDDLIQETWPKFVTAVKSYDESQGKFLAYLNRPLLTVLRGYLSRNCGSIVLPDYFFYKLDKMRRMERNFALSEGREPSAEEVAELMGETAENIKFLRLTNLRMNALSIDDLTEDYEDGDTAPQEPSTEDFSSNLCEDMDNEAESEVLQDFIREKLTPRQHEIITAYYLNDEKSTEIQKRLHISRAAFWSRHNCAIANLRANKEELRERLDNPYTSYRSYHLSLGDFTRNGSGVERLAIKIIDKENRQNGRNNKT